MSTYAIPAFSGKITVSSANNKIDWREDNGGGPFDLSATVPAGEYWISDLSIAIAAAMSTVSASSGDNLTYTGQFDQSSCTVLLEVSAGGFYPKLTIAETSKILTGGDQDTESNTLTAGFYGLNHLGFEVQSSYPSLEVEFTSDLIAANHWIPSEPIATDTKYTFEQNNLVSEAEAPDGSSNVRDWRGWKLDVNDPEFGSWGGNWSRRDLTFEFQLNAARLQWINWFWGPYAKSGGVFRFYPDKSQTDYDGVCRLAAESLRSSWRGERLRGYDYYSHTITMKREALL